jgi:hypothetical protein
MSNLIKAYISGFFLLIAFSIWFFWPVLKNTFVYNPINGDIVFQSLPPNPLVNAIEGITQSPFSHCGIVYLDEDGKWSVYESLGTVHSTPLSKWMLRGSNSGVSVYRPAFKPDEINRMLAAAFKFNGLKYDVKYEMDDDKIYCSELVYKAFKNGIGIEIGKLEKLGDLNWKDYEKTIVKYENGPVPLDRLMITPVGLTRDQNFVRVYSSF